FTEWREQRTVDDELVRIAVDQEHRFPEALGAELELLDDVRERWPRDSAFLEHLRVERDDDRRIIALACDSETVAQPGDIRAIAFERFLERCCIVEPEVVVGTDDIDRDEEDAASFPACVLDVCLER